MKLDTYAFANSLSASERERLIGVLNIDMGGPSVRNVKEQLVVSTKGDPAVCGWDLPQPNAISDAISQAYALLGIDFGTFIPVDNAGKHDTVAFYRSGIPSATVAWREWDPTRCSGSISDAATPLFIHSEQDTLENLDVEMTRETAKLILLATVLLATQETEGN